ncbi:helix-turn-helix domain-containing protein [Collinsella sp. AGMB00827]|uniref:Helix-turn-helix domain-containing protein n=1 Tax=Collinsella ureilytica TaxID=2869515 RepID=A0ABS7MM71_9ACTN|nr:helix-turn-helix transcriptional regulator [Collinsella urealyticum]MBY4798397.1 helix-turn-helix domain-containing protein [Collinsella urealyticum]
MEDFKSMFGHRLKVARVDARLTQAELAERVGLSNKSVSLYESGAVCPAFETVYAIADALNVSPNELCGWWTRDESPQIPA